METAHRQLHCAIRALYGDTAFIFLEKYSLLVERLLMTVCEPRRPGSHREPVCLGDQAERSSECWCSGQKRRGTAEQTGLADCWKAREFTLKSVLKIRPLALALKPLARSSEWTE